MPRETTLGNPRREPEPQPDSVIIGVTTSPRRQHYLRSLAVFSHHQVMFAKGPNPELDHPDMFQVAKHKVDFVLDPENPENKVEAFSSGSGNFVIAADVRTRPLVLHGSDVNQRLVPDRPPSAISLGKPESLEDVRRTLVKMDRAIKEGKDGYYEIETGTYLRARGGLINGTHDSVTAVLDTDLIRHFSTPKGFTQYVEGFYRFYSTEDTQHLGIPKLTDVAGGLSLGTLLKLGAIKYLDGISRDDPRFRTAVKMALNKALFGFNPGVMKQISPDIQRFIDSYPLLETATEIALAKAA